MGLAVIAGAFAQAQAQGPSPAASPASAPSPSATTVPTAVPLPEVVAAADALSARLQQTETDIAAHPTGANITRGLPTLVEEISAREVETKRMLRPGVPMEALGDAELRWQKLSDRLALWTTELTNRATLLDREIGQCPELRATWRATLELARSSDAPPELSQRIEAVLKAIDDTEDALTKRRAAILSLQTRVAQQTQRVHAALRSVRTAQSAAANRLWVQDSPPIWSPQVRADVANAIARESQVSLGAQATQLRVYLGREWIRFVSLALILCALAFILVRIKARAARSTEQDPALERANRVLQLPIATACVLTFILSRAILQEAPRAIWVVLATLTLIPIVILLRRLIDRHLFPILNALVVFYFVAQLRALTAAMPVLSRIILLLEMIGGAVFLAWFIRSTRRVPNGTTSRKATRAAARVGVVLFALVFVANAFGYVALANYLGTGALAAAYLAILLYAAAGILEGLVFFALQIRPLASLGVVRKHRPLLRRRIARVIYTAAFIVWLLLTLGAFALRAPAIERLRAFINAEIGFRSLHISLGAVLAFALTVWLALLLSRFIRFILEEEIYDRFRLARGPAYAVSTLVHYVILLLGFYAAIAAVGADMTRFAILAGAFGVGIGFGLQNIFNNFFSGLILLFERPVQVGDVIEVGTFTGVVRRIGIRASVIALADGSQLIIPNGQLIAEKVTNRTASSRQKRMELRLRIAYGADPQQVIDVLTRTAAAHPSVADQPPPEAFLKEFRPDALQFELGFWTDEVARAPHIQSKVAVAVNAALAEAGIAMPLPQPAELTASAQF